MNSYNTGTVHLSKDALDTLLELLELAEEGQFKLLFKVATVSCGIGWARGMVGRVVGVVTGISWWLVGGIGGWGMGGYVGLLVGVSFLYASLPQFVQAECN